MDGLKTFLVWLLGCFYFLVLRLSLVNVCQFGFYFMANVWVDGWLSWVEFGALGLVFTCLYKLCTFGWGFALISLDWARNRFARHFMKCKIDGESDGEDQEVGIVVKFVSSNSNLRVYLSRIRGKGVAIEVFGACTSMGGDSINAVIHQ